MDCFARLLDRRLQHGLAFRGTMYPAGRPWEELTCCRFEPYGRVLLTAPMAYSQVLAFDSPSLFLTILPSRLETHLLSFHSIEKAHIILSLTERRYPKIRYCLRS